MNKVGIRLAAALAIAAFALGSGCGAEEDKAAKKPAEEKTVAVSTQMADGSDVPDAKTAEETKAADMKVEEAKTADMKVEEAKTADMKVEEAKTAETLASEPQAEPEEKTVVAQASGAEAAADEDDDEEEVDESLAAELVTLDDGFTSQKGATVEDGKWGLPEGSPTFHVIATKEKIGLDWYTYNGYRRYHDACHVCHGPDGAGSTYAPALADSLKNISYSDFVGIVAAGRVAEQPDGSKSVMPEFGVNKNVMCYIDDIYVYLKARATGAWPRLKPSGRQRDPKPEAAKQYDKECFGE